MLVSQSWPIRFTMENRPSRKQQYEVAVKRELIRINTAKVLLNKCTLTDLFQALFLLCDCYSEMSISGL